MRELDSFKANRVCHSLSATLLLLLLLSVTCCCCIHVMLCHNKASNLSSLQSMQKHFSVQTYTYTYICMIAVFTAETHIVELCVYDTIYLQSISTSSSSGSTAVLLY